MSESRLFNKRQCVNSSFSQKVNCLSGMIGAEEFEFNERPIKADGDCGFYALNISRNTLVESLLLQTENSEAREYLSEEIQEAFLGEWSYPLSKEWNSLIKQRDDIQNKIDECVRDLKTKLSAEEGKDKTAEDLIDLLSQRVNLDQDIQKSYDELYDLHFESTLIAAQMKSYCSSEQVFKDYIESYLKSYSIEGDDHEYQIWLGSKTALLYAKHNNFTLYIWNKQANSQKLQMINHHMSEAPNAEVIHMLLTNGSTHFNLLEKLERPLQLTEMMTQEINIPEMAQVTHLTDTTHVTNTTQTQGDNHRVRFEVRRKLF